MIAFGFSLYDTWASVILVDKLDPAFSCALLKSIALFLFATIYLAARLFAMFLHNLWRPGDNVYVYSSMCPLDMVMKIQTVTFTQDRNQGTLTTLDCVAPWNLNDRRNLNPGDPKPGGEKIVTTPVPV
jgi:hypothetical protein